MHSKAWKSLVHTSGELFPRWTMWCCRLTREWEEEAQINQGPSSAEEPRASWQ
jgi:hypothetical protein